MLRFDAMSRLRGVRGRLAPLLPAARWHRRIRRRLARKYLCGRGLEIGALHAPLEVPRSTSVRYVDRLGVASLRTLYPELNSVPLVEPDIVDNGEALSSQPDGSADFIIANHLIEHTEDPLGTLANHLRVVRPKGIIYMAVPDRTRTFDRMREPTTWEHLLRDHAEGPGSSRQSHFEEWARLVERAPESVVEQRAKSLADMGYSVHFHVWSPNEFAAMLDRAKQELSLPFEVVERRNNGAEVIFILRRTQRLAPV